MSFTKTSDIVYYNSGDKKMLLDLYVPSTLSLLGSVSNKSLDLIIFFYGGGLEIGAKEDLEPLAKEFASSGAIFAAPNYCLFPDAKYPDFIKDGANAVSWLKANIHKYLPPEIAKANVRIYVGGHSAGGYIALMLALNPDYLSEAGVNPADISGFIAASGQPTTHFNVLKFRGDSPDGEIFDEAAPIYHARNYTGDTPILILCSKNDIPKRFEQTELLKAELDKTNKGKTEVIIFNDHDHGSYMGPRKGAINSDLFSACQRFINRLK